jgi:hypothetical protein
LTSPTVIDGVTVPAGTYIKKANIHTAAITSAKIEDAAITNAKILDATIQAAKIQDATITTAKIGNAQITNAKIVDAAITTAKIQDAQITTAKIVDLAVNTLKIQGNAVTVPSNTSSGSVVAGNGGYQGVLSMTVTNTSNVFMPVVLIFSGVVGYSAGVRTVGFRLLANGSQLVEFAFFSGGFVSLPTYQAYHGINPGQSVTYVADFW